MYSTSAIVGLAYAIDLFFNRINLKNKEFCYGFVFKVLFSLSAFFCYTMVDNVLFAQTQSSDSYASSLGKGYFVIKGKVENKPSDMNGWELAVTDYLDNIPYTVGIDNDGYFEEKIPISDVQDIYFYLGDAITIFSYPNDTIEVYFDAKHQKKSVELRGRNEERKKELALSMDIFRKCRESFLNMIRLRYKQGIEDDVLIAELNGYYNSKLGVIDSFERENGNFLFLQKFRDETYFETIQLLTHKKGLLDCIDFPKTAGYRVSGKGDTLFYKPYESLSMDRFRTNPSYRSFLQFYIPASRLNFDRTRPTSIWDDYYFALSCLHVEPIRDWYISQALFTAFTYRDFKETSECYTKFTTICSNKDYIDILDRKHRAGVSTQPGMPAPDFELRDENGKLVRLSDFKGKTVYIDFWGMGCGPCIQEFTEAAPKFREMYGEYDIVYVYINVADSEKSWRQGIEKYNLEGINLIAEGWSKNPVCQAYNVLGIPHYVLIDEDGVVVKNKTDRPSDILRKKSKSEFDQTVRKNKSSI